MADLRTIYDGPLKLNKVLTYLSGPLPMNYLSANGVSFPPTKAKVVSLSGTTRTLLLESTTTASEVALLSGNTPGKFFFERVSDTHLHLRLSSAQIEAFARTGSSVWIELVRIAGDSDLDDEPVALQEVGFSAAGLELSAAPDPINFNVNGTTLSLVFSLPGAQATQTVTGLDDLLALHNATLASNPNYEPFDVFVRSDVNYGGKRRKYQLGPDGPPVPYATEDSPFA